MNTPEPTAEQRLSEACIDEHYEKVAANRPISPEPIAEARRLSEARWIVEPAIKHFLLVSNGRDCKTLSETLESNIATALAEKDAEIQRLHESEDALCSCVIACGFPHPGDGEGIEAGDCVKMVKSAIEDLRTERDTLKAEVERLHRTHKRKVIEATITLEQELTTLKALLVDGERFVAGLMEEVTTTGIASQHMVEADEWLSDVAKLVGGKEGGGVNQELLKDLKAWMERHLQTLHPRQNKSVYLNDNKTNGYAVAEIPDWELRQKLESVTEAMINQKNPQ